jgi:hypothetical protein
MASSSFQVAFTILAELMDKYNPNAADSNNASMISAGSEGMRDG